MNKILLIFSSLFFFSVTLNAETLTKTIVVEGYGVSYADAIKNGLIESLKQAKGVSIDSQKTYVKSIKERAVSTADNGSSREVEVDKQMLHRVREATEGVINQYSIINSQNDGDGQWNVRLEVRLSQYKTPGYSPKNRRSLAVMPPHTLQNRYVFSGYSVRHDEFSRRLQQALITELTQARRFSIMDRDYNREYLREKRLLAGPDAAISEYAKIGQVLGVDYMVTSTVTDAELKKSSHTIAALGETRSTHTGRFRVEYRIIVMATRQIKWSGTSDLDFSGSRVPGKLVNNGEALADYMIATVAKDINRQILNNIYPLQLVKISANGNLILNQGGVTVKQGERYTILALGEEIFDPYTKELLGREETQVGTAEIISINPKYSVARLVKGSKSSIAEGMLLRFPKRAAVPKKKPMKVQTPAW